MYMSLAAWGVQPFGVAAAFLLIFSAIVFLCLRGVRLTAVATVPGIGMAVGCAAWSIGVFDQGHAYLGGQVPYGLLVVAFVSGSLWNFWLGWMVVWNRRWIARFAALAALLLVQTFVFLVFAIDDSLGH